MNIQSMKTDDGIDNITRFNKSQKIISGTFCEGYISLGRFDIKYKDKTMKPDEGTGL